MPPSDQTAPDGKPALDVGIFKIDKLFTNVVQTLLAVIQEPTIIVSAQVFVLLHCPPKIDDLSPDAVLQQPPPIVDIYPDEVFLLPPPTNENSHDEVLR